MGVPRMSSRSKEVNIRMSWSPKMRAMGEIMIGIVTRTIVRIVDAPETRPASSSAASMLRKIGVSIITVVEEAPPTTWMKMSPGML